MAPRPRRRHGVRRRPEGSARTARGVEAERRDRPRGASAPGGPGRRLRDLRDRSVDLGLACRPLPATPDAGPAPGRRPLASGRGFGRPGGPRQHGRCSPGRTAGPALLAPGAPPGSGGDRDGSRRLSRPAGHHGRRSPPRRRLLGGGAGGQHASRCLRPGGDGDRSVGGGGDRHQPPAHRPGSGIRRRAGGQCPSRPPGSGRRRRAPFGLGGAAHGRRPLVGAPTVRVWWRWCRPWRTSARRPPADRRSAAAALGRTRVAPSHQGSSGIGGDPPSGIGGDPPAARRRTTRS